LPPSLAHPSPKTNPGRLHRRIDTPFLPARGFRFAPSMRLTPPGIGAGYRFQASLEEPLWVDGNMVVAKGADVYGRLDESKETGTFAGRSQLKLQLTGIVVNGQTLPIVTGEYEVSGKSKGESTAKRTVGGAAIGGIIGALAGGGKGAAIGAGTGAGVGAGSEIITKGDQVKIPSETLLDFTLQQSIILPKHTA